MCVTLHTVCLKFLSVSLGHLRHAPGGHHPNRNIIHEQERAQKRSTLKTKQLDRATT